MTTDCDQEFRWDLSGDSLYLVGDTPFEPCDVGGTRRESLASVGSFETDMVEWLR